MKTQKLKPITLSLILLIIFSFSSLATTYQSKQNGSWGTNSTWENNLRPPTSLGSTDLVIIKHDVVMNGNISCFGDVTINEGGYLYSNNRYLWMRGYGELTVNGTIYVSYIYMYDNSTLVSSGTVATKYDLYVYGEVDATFNNQCNIGDDLLIYSYSGSSYSGANLVFNDEVNISDDFLLSYKSNVEFKDDLNIGDDITYIDGTASFEGNTYVGGKCDDIYYSDSVTISGTFHVDEQFELYNATVTITSTGSLSTNSDFKSEGAYAVFTNYGTIDIYDDLDIQSGDFDNYGTITCDEFKLTIEFTNNGNLIIKNKFVVDKNEFTNEGTVYAMDQMENSESIINNGTFTVDEEFENDGDFTNGSTGVFTSHEEFENKDVLVNNGIMNIDKFDSKNPLTNNNYLNIYEYFDNSGTVYNNSNGKICLKSSSTGTATLIDAGTITGAGQCIMELFLKGEQWHYVSIPLESVSSNVFWGGAIYSYDETNESWKAHHNDESLDVTKGYDVYFKNDKVIEFVGTFNSGDQTIATKKTSSNSGYNLIANPYPAVIDWQNTLGWTKNNVDNSTYIWNPASQNVSSYVNGVSTNQGSRYIAAMQGYFVKCNSTTGSVKLKKTVLKHKTYSNYREGDETSDELLKLKITSDNGFSDEAAIRFNHNASIKYDGNFDADKMWSANITVPQIYTISSDFQELSINSIPEVKEEVSIPLYMKARVTANNSIEVDVKNMTSIYNVYLEDLKLNSYHDMLTGPYVFSADVNDDDFRFIIHFTKQNVFSIDTLQSALSVLEKTEDDPFKVYASQGAIVVEQAPNLENPSTIWIFNMVGKEVKKLKSDQAYQLIELNAAAAYYTVQINNAKLSYTHKVLVR